MILQVRSCIQDLACKAPVAVSTLWAENLEEIYYKAAITVPSFLLSPGEPMKVYLVGIPKYCL